MAGTGEGARWTLARRRQFLAALAVSADAGAAARAVGETLRAARNLRARDRAFGEAWDQAIGAAHALVEEGLLRRMLTLLAAEDGTEGGEAGAGTTGLSITPPLSATEVQFYLKLLSRRDALANGGEERLVDLVQSLRAPYRQGACFVMNAATSARIRKIKTTDGQFLWAPGLAAGQPATLLGYPVIEAEDMPDIAENACAIAFGNFQAGYLIAERAETAILRDPYSNKPFVTFYATRRVGGCVSDSEAIKLMKFAVN